MRRHSLDVLRGLDVALLLLVEWILPSSAYSWLRHSPWQGIRIADVVFPLFLFLVGTSMAVGRRRGWRRHVRRAITLIVVGLVFNAWGDSNADLAHLRVPGVLQMIGVAGLLGAFVVWLCRDRAGAVAAAAFAFVGVHALVLSQLPTACGTGRLVPGCSAPWVIDRRVFGAAHLYHGGQFGHDPEGLVNTVLGATAFVLLGFVAGRLLADPGRSLLLATTCLAGAGVMAILYPPMKRLWTPTFTLLLAAGFVVVLLGLALLLDGREHRRPQPIRWTFGALGRNALLVYVSQHLVLVSLEATRSGDHSLADALRDRVGSLLGVALLAVVVWTVIAAVLRALDWYVTV